MPKYMFHSLDDFFLFFFFCFVSGQVGGLASASAVFQSRLDTELHERLPPGSEEVCWITQVFAIPFKGLILFFSKAYQKHPPLSAFSRDPAC